MAVGRSGIFRSGATKNALRRKFFEKGVRKDFTKLRLLGTSLLLFAGNDRKNKILLAKKNVSR